MATITLYCPETPSLKLGPGTIGLGEGSTPGQVIVFRNGFADIDPAAYPDWERWANHPGTPGIENLGSNDEGVVPTGSTEFVCEQCDPPRTFDNKRALNGHLLAHRRKAAAGK